MDMVLATLIPAIIQHRIIITALYITTITVIITIITDVFLIIGLGIIGEATAIVLSVTLIITIVILIVCWDIICWVLLIDLQVCR